MQLSTVIVFSQSDSHRINNVIYPYPLALLHRLVQPWVWTKLLRFALKPPVTSSSYTLSTDHSVSRYTQTHRQLGNISPGSRRTHFPSLTHFISKLFSSVLKEIT